MKEQPSGLVDKNQTWGAALAVLVRRDGSADRDVAAATVAHAISTELARQGVDHGWYDVYDWVWEGDWWDTLIDTYNPVDLAREWLDSGA